MSKNHKIMSVSVKPEQHDQLNRIAKVKSVQEGKKVTVSAIVRDIVDAYFDKDEDEDELNVNLDGDVKDLLQTASQNRDICASKLVNDTLKRCLVVDDSVPVILKIPSDLKGQRKELAQWLQVRATAVLDKLAKAD
jgi:hypothetical protein